MQEEPLRVEKNALILAVDIRGFTPLCEKIGLRRAGRFIDEFYTIVRNTLNKVTNKKSEIVIDRFLGDAVLAFIFNEKGGSAKAVESAFDIRNILKEKIKNELSFTNAGVSIAIGKGTILHGKFGEECSRESLVCPDDWKGETTGIGPSINKTFRMLSLAIKNQILVSDEVWRDIRNDYIWTELNSIYVKGIRAPIIPYWILRSGQWDGQRYCTTCSFCDHHKYCKKSYEFGNTERTSSIYVKSKWEIEKMIRCDERRNMQGNWCSGCEINHLSSNPKQKACHENYLKGLNEKYDLRVCCQDCGKYFTCQFNLHRGKNHVPSVERQIKRKRYCCEACNYFKEPAVDCVNNRMRCQEKDCCVN